MRPRPHRLLAVALAAATLLAACGGDDDSSSGGGDDTSLSLVGYAVPKAAYDKLQPAFAETPEGEGVTWESSYGASGDQSRAVVNGLDADYVNFSLTPDVTRLVDAGLVAEDWDRGPSNGIVTDSVVVLVVREGNPKGIQGWDDIVADGVEIVTPNPGSSGSARWNILGAYGQVLASGGTEDDAIAFVEQFIDNVVALPASGREATSAFTGGTGDVLISYENEAILARQQGEDIEYIVPENTFLIENPAAVTVEAPPAASAFLEFALSPAGQELFSSVGFRPVIDGVEVGPVEGANDPANPFPDVNTTTVADLGGWSEINAKFFNEDDGLITQMLQEKGTAG